MTTQGDGKESRLRGDGSGDSGGLLDSIRGLLGNQVPDSARERSGRERQASRTVRGKRANPGEREGTPNPQALRAHSQTHAEDARQRNRAIEEQVRDFNEGLAQTASDLEDELEEFIEYGEREVSDELEWEHNPGRSFETEEVSGDNLFSYLADRSEELDNVFDKITNVNSTIESDRERKSSLEDELEEKRQKKPEEEERVRLEKQDNMTASEAREAEIDEITSFADDVAESKASVIGEEIEELEASLSAVNDRIASLEDTESALYDAREEIVDEIEEVYEPHAERMEEVVRGLSRELDEGIGYLEDLAGIELPNLTEEQGTKYVDDAASELQRARGEAADALVSRISELATYLANVEDEHEDLVSVLPDQYVEDGQFARIDVADDVLSGVSDELSGSYDTVMDRISDAYQEATGENFYEAFDDADSTIAQLRASYADEVTE